MTPDFDELVGGSGAPGEREELRRVHELLVSATPPPALPRRLARPPRLGRRLPPLPRPRIQALVGLAAAAAVTLGVVIGFALDDGGFSPGLTRPMHPVGRVAAASAAIEIGGRDGGGNRPLKLSARGLPALGSEGWYELDLTKDGKIEASCGAFTTDRRGSADVRMNAPYDLREYDGWVVTSHVPGGRPRVLLST
jgi:hypothetical protein